MLRLRKPTRWQSPPLNRRADAESERTELAKAQRKLDHYRASLRHSGSEIEHRNHIIRTLTSFTYQANQLAEPSALLEFALSQAIKTSSADAGAIILFDQESKRLTVGAHSEIGRELLGILTGRQLDAAATLLMPHLVTGRGALLELTAMSENGERRLLEAANLKSLASLPLQAGDRLLGALVVGTRNKESFLPADLHGLLVIAQETAAAWESLHLRDRLWQMAESLLDHSSKPAELNGKTSYHEPILDSHSQASFEQWLVETAMRVGVPIAALIALGTDNEGRPATLLATHGLSPQFGKQYAQGFDANETFPFRKLRQRNLLIKDLTAANAIHTFPLLVSLEMEGARSLLALQLNGDDVDLREKVLIVAATTPGALDASHVGQLLAEQPQLATGVTRGLGRSRHLLAIAGKATDDEVAMLHSAAETIVKKAKAKASEKNQSLYLSNQILQELNGLSISK